MAQRGRTPASTARGRPPEEAAEDSSFARGLRVLLTVADRGDVRADELGAILDTPTSSIYRYLRTLSEFGFVERSDEAGYRLGPNLRIESGERITGEQLIRASDPVLRDLAERTGETAVISRRIGLSAVRLHQVESSHPLRVILEQGTALPLHAGALAKVLLANAPDEIVDQVLSRELPRLTDTTPDRATIRAELATIRAEGVAVSAGEAIDGSVAVAAPILLHDGIVAAIGVVGPAARCGKGWRTTAAKRLTKAAAVVAAALATEREGAAVEG